MTTKTLIPYESDGPRGFEQVKKELEAEMAALAHGTNAVFKVVTDSEWVGECPSPGAKALSKRETQHQSDEAKVCLDCYKVHFLPESFENGMTAKEHLPTLAQWVVDQYHKRVPIGRV